MLARYCKLNCVFKMSIVLSSVIMLGSFFFFNSKRNTSSEGLLLLYEVTDESAVDSLNSEEEYDPLDKEQGMEYGRKFTRFIKGKR